MSRIVLGVGLALAIAGGGWLGWSLGEPALDKAQAAAPKPPMVGRPADDDGPPVADGPPGSDHEPGWRRRAALRDRLAKTIAALRAKPCETPPRQALLAAFADRARAVIDDDAKGAGVLEAHWRTDADDDLEDQLKQLDAEGLTTEAERVHEVVSRTRQGAALIAAGRVATPEQPAVLSSPRCHSEIAALH